MTAGHPHPHLHEDAKHGHGNGHVHLGEEDWAAYAADTELQGEVFIRFLTDTIDWINHERGTHAPVVRRVLDVGSGPGVGACQLALSYPDARVTAVDSSPAMLAMAVARAARLGLGERVNTRLAELPEGLEGLEGVDLIWASMSLHHVGDEVGVLRVLRGLLASGGLIAIAEMAEPTRLLPADLDVGRPGLVERLDAAAASWFGDMRHGLAGSVDSSDFSSMLGATGFDVVGLRIARHRIDAPLSADARQVAQGELQRVRAQLGERLEADDERTLDILCDEDDPRGAMRRPDLFMESSRQIFIARPGAARR
jgi:SAM-dependent methyltransferase